MDKFDSYEREQKADSCERFRPDFDRIPAYGAILDGHERVTVESDPAKKGAAFVEMAENYLKFAVAADSRGDFRGTRMIVNGTQLGREELNKNGDKRGYDGILDVLSLAQKSGIRDQTLDPLKQCAFELLDSARRRESIPPNSQKRNLY